MSNDPYDQFNSFEDRMNAQKVEQERKAREIEAIRISEKIKLQDKLQEIVAAANNALTPLNFKLRSKGRFEARISPNHLFRDDLSGAVDVSLVNNLDEPLSKFKISLSSSGDITIGYGTPQAVRVSSINSLGFETIQEAATRILVEYNNKRESK